MMLIHIMYAADEPSIQSLAERLNATPAEMDEIFRGIPAEQRAVVLESVMRLPGAEQWTRTELMDVIEAGSLFPIDQIALVFRSVMELPGARQWTVSERAQVIGAVGNLPVDQIAAVFRSAMEFPGAEQWTINELGSVMGVLSCVPIEERDEVLARVSGRIAEAEVGRVFRYNDIAQLIHERGLDPLRRPGAHRGNDSTQVHREAAKYMPILWPWFNEQLGGEPRLSIDECMKLIHQWVSELKEDDFTKGLGKLEIIKQKMRDLLTHQKWEGALTTTWSNLGEGVTGEILLRTAVTYCAKHPEQINAFLLQGLWDAITAYIDNPDGLDDLSCTQGITERWIMWARALHPDIIAKEALLMKIIQEVYTDPRVEALIYIETLSGEVLLKQYPDVESAEALREIVLGNLDKLLADILKKLSESHSPEVMKEVKDKLNAAFEGVRNLSYFTEAYKKIEAARVSPSALAAQAAERRAEDRKRGDKPGES